MNDMVEQALGIQVNEDNTFFISEADATRLSKEPGNNTCWTEGWYFTLPWGWERGGATREETHEMMLKAAEEL